VTDSEDDKGKQQGRRPQQSDDAYTIAKNGGKHSPWYNLYKDKVETEIRRGIRSIEKQIREHQDKIANPRKHIADFDSLPPRKREGLLKSKWLKDIRRQEEQKRILEGILKERGL
jgi:hypothetical protein